jgi:hypothetical protein
MTSGHPEKIVTLVDYKMLTLEFDSKHVLISFGNGVNPLDWVHLFSL